MDERIATLQKEAEEVAEMIRAATSSLMPSTQSKESARSIREEQQQHDPRNNKAHSRPPDTIPSGKNETEDSFRAAVESFFRSILGSCGGVIEVATYFVKHTWKPSDDDVKKGTTSAPETAPNARFSRNQTFWDERRRRPFFYNVHFNDRTGRQSSEIPTLLMGAEDDCLDITQNFDDNISALSAHTLEEMALQNHSFRGDAFPTMMMPPPAMTQSSSSSLSTSKSSERLPAHPTTQLDISSGEIPMPLVMKVRSHTSIVIEEDDGADFGHVHFLPPRIPKRQLLEV